MFPVMKSRQFKEIPFDQFQIIAQLTGTRKFKINY